MRNNNNNNNNNVENALADLSVGTRRSTSFAIYCYTFFAPKRNVITVCVCAVIPFLLDVRFVDVPAGVTQGEGHT